MCPALLFEESLTCASYLLKTPFPSPNMNGQSRKLFNWCIVNANNLNAADRILLFKRFGTRVLRFQNMPHVKIFFTCKRFEWLGLFGISLGLNRIQTNKRVLIDISIIWLSQYDPLLARPPPARPHPLTCQFFEACGVHSSARRSHGASAASGHNYMGPAFSKKQMCQQS